MYVHKIVYIDTHTYTHTHTCRICFIVGHMDSVLEGLGSMESHASSYYGRGCLVRK